MRLTPFRMFAGRSATCAVVLVVSTALPTGHAQNEKVNQGLHAAGSTVSQGASLLGGALPGGAVISAAVSSVSSLGGAGGGASAAAYAATGRVLLTPVGGGKTVSCDLADDGSFELKGLKPGTYHLRISMNVTVPKQTQGATFGEKVNSGKASEAGNRAKHDTAKNSIGNIRARTGGNETEGGAGKNVDNVNGGMPNRISMNVTVAKQNLTASEDGESVNVQVDEDGTLAGRASATQQAQGAEPASSGHSGPEPTGLEGGTPPRPAGG